MIIYVISLPSPLPPPPPSLQFTKLRTITTKMNSIKQTKKAIYPVKVEGGGAGGEWAEPEGDVLWCTEMERYRLVN